ncbi:MAG: helix-turn-helix domain-containing protein, partial [Calditrichota bacterium]
ITSGLFREELYYRLNQLVLHTPPLRDHPEDIPELTSHFLPLANRKNNRYISGISRDAMYHLLRHRWPGNVRQLQSVILRSVAFADNEEIAAQEVLDAMEGAGQFQSVPPEKKNEPVALSEVLTMADAVAEFQRQYLIAVLYACNGRKGETAAKLGLSRQTFYRLMEKLELNKLDFEL